MCRPTWPAHDERRYVLDHLPRWWSRSTMRAARHADGLAAGADELAEFGAASGGAAPLHRPARVELSTCPTLLPDRRGRAAPRRPAALRADSSEGPWVLPGGLTAWRWSGLVRGQLEPGRGLQGHLGAEVTAPVPHASSLGWPTAAWVGRSSSAASRQRASCRPPTTWPSTASSAPARAGTRSSSSPARRPASRALRRRGVDDGEQCSGILCVTGVHRSLRRSVAAARENARSIRDVLSAEPWRRSRAAPLLGGAPCQLEWQSQRDAFYRRVRQSTQLCWACCARPAARHPLDFIGWACCWSGWPDRRLLDVHYHTFARPAAPPGSTDRGVMSLCAPAPVRAVHGAQRAGDRPTVARFIFARRASRAQIAYCVTAYDRLCAIRPPSDDHLPAARRWPVWRARPLVKSQPPIAATT